MPHRIQPCVNEATPCAGGFRVTTFGHDGLVEPRVEGGHGLETLSLVRFSQILTCILKQLSENEHVAVRNPACAR